MNKLASLLVISFILSCSQKMNLSGNYSRDFSRVEKKQLYAQVSTHGKFSIKTKVIIEGVVVNNVKKIGLYTYKIYNNKSVGVKNKLLKFKSKILFTSKDDESNKIIINQFQKEYSKYFTPEQMEKIRESFLKGPEMIGRFL